MIGSEEPVGRVSVGFIGNRGYNYNKNSIYGVVTYFVCEYRDSSDVE